jgi:hypothetical protein
MLTERGRLLLNLVGVNAGWFACVLGAAHGVPWLGPAVVPALVAAHLWLQPGWPRELRLALLTGGVGLVLDTGLIAAGMMEPQRWLLPAPLSTVWLVALWVNLAPALTVALGWLQGRWGLAALFGLVGGPAAYHAGARLGAVELASPVWRSWLAIGLGWALAMPLLVWLARQPEERGGGDDHLDQEDDEHGAVG